MCYESKCQNQCQSQNKGCKCDQQGIHKLFGYLMHTNQFNALHQHLCKIQHDQQIKGIHEHLCKLEEKAMHGELFKRLERIECLLHDSCRK